MSYDDGTLLTIMPASRVGRLINGHCTIICKRVGAKTQQLVVTDNIFSTPVIISYDKTRRQIDCLFDLQDIGPQLLKGEVEFGFDGLRAGGHLNEIVRSSTMKISEGTSGDWEKEHNFVKTLSSAKFGNKSAANSELTYIPSALDPDVILPQMRVHFGSGLSN